MCLFRKPGCIHVFFLISIGFWGYSNHLAFCHRAVFYCDLYGGRVFSVFLFPGRIRISSDAEIIGIPRCKLAYRIAFLSSGLDPMVFFGTGLLIYLIPPGSCCCIPCQFYFFIGCFALTPVTFPRVAALTGTAHRQRTSRNINKILFFIFSPFRKRYQCFMKHADGLSGFLGYCFSWCKHV